MSDDPGPGADGGEDTDAGAGGPPNADGGTGQDGGARRGEETGGGDATGGGTFAEERLVGLVVLGGALLLAVLVAVGVLDLSYLLFLLSLAGIYVLLSMGLNVQWGYTGLINFSVAAFFGLGAYGVALVTSSVSPFSEGFPFASPVVGLLFGLVAAGVVALLIGLPTLSLSEDYLAIATLGLAEVVRLVLLTENQWTNGSAGLYGIPRLYTDWPVVGDLSGRLADPIVTFLLVLVAVLGVWLLLRRAHQSPWGRVQRLVRTDEDLAAALGKNTYRLRLQSFVIGSLVMALAGALFASVIVFVDPGLLSPIQTFYVWIAVILGGTGSDRGAILGGALVVTIIEGTRELGKLAGTVAVGGVELNLQPGPLRLFAIGLLIILVIHFRPQGVLPPRRELIWTGREASGEVESGGRDA